jgi:putative addiction module component (TIGR02574 family)
MISPMSARFDDLARQAMSLSREEKEALLRALIADLDGPPEGSEEEIAQLWAEEARRRFDEYLRGEVQAIPADEVMAEARSRLK